MVAEKRFSHVFLNNALAAVKHITTSSGVSLSLFLSGELFQEQWYYLSVSICHWQMQQCPTIGIGMHQWKILEAVKQLYKDSKEFNAWCKGLSMILTINQADAFHQQELKKCTCKLILCQFEQKGIWAVECHSCYVLARRQQNHIACGHCALHLSCQAPSRIIVP